jgi:hypothetical protein
MTILIKTNVILITIQLFTVARPRPRGKVSGYG